MPAERFRVHGWLRSLVALTLIGSASVLALAVHDLEFGIGWIVLIPAAAIVLVGLGLFQRRSIVAEPPGRIVVISGWCFRRHLTLAVDGGELELVPTMGLIAVVLHRQGRNWPIAEWLTPRRADALAALIDRAASAPLARRIAIVRDHGDR